MLLLPVGLPLPEFASFSSFGFLPLSNSSVFVAPFFSDPLFLWATFLLVAEDASRLKRLRTSGVTFIFPSSLIIFFSRRKFASSAIVKNELKRENENSCHWNQNVTILFSYLVRACFIGEICLFLFLFIFPILLLFFLFHCVNTVSISPTLCYICAKGQLIWTLHCLFAYASKCSCCI